MVLMALFIYLFIYFFFRISSFFTNPPVSSTTTNEQQHTHTWWTNLQSQLNGEVCCLLQFFSRDFFIEHKKNPSGCLRSPFSEDFFIHFLSDFKFLPHLTRFKRLQLPLLSPINIKKNELTPTSTGIPKTRKLSAYPSFKG